jgi:hypothetical protein
VHHEGSRRILPLAKRPENSEPNFYEKTLSVKPTCRPLCDERNYSALGAMLPFALSRGSTFLVAPCIMRSVFSS